MKTQRCDKCPKVTIGGFERQALCDECAAQLAGHAATLCRNSPGTGDVDPNRPEHMTFLEWYRVWFSGGHCEPRRWLPQRWSDCANVRWWRKTDCEGLDMCERHTDEYSAPWFDGVFDNNAGTCTPGVGPVCEVGT